MRWKNKIYKKKTGLRQVSERNKVFKLFKFTQGFINDRGVVFLRKSKILSN